MATQTSSKKRSTDAVRVPCPTHPVAGRETDSETPAFDWTPIPDATQYRLQLAPADDFETMYYDEPIERRESISLSSVLPEDVTTVYWHVRAERKDGTASGWSQPARFRRPGTTPEHSDTAVRVDAPPQPLAPRKPGGRPVNPSALQFSWKGIPEASGYQIQAAPTSDFDEPAVNLTVDQRTTVNLYDALPSDRSTLYWRSRALFPVAAPGPWSESTPFAVATGTETDGPENATTDDAERYARAQGPVLEGRTSSRLTLVVGLIVVLSFAATILLIAIAS